MSKDPYELLGVARDAAQGDITKAYRKLAKELHPDLNPGDAAAEERFKEVSAAYHLLNDPEQRARYDRGEIDASGADRPQQEFYRRYADTGEGTRYHSTSSFEDFADASDLFSELFGQQEARRGTVKMRGRDQHYHLEIDFLEAAEGAKRRVAFPQGKSLDLNIPAGTRDGATLRLKAKGGAGLNGGSAGDALVEISVRPHRLFRRDGDDILLELPVAIDEAVLGARVEVPTVSGRVAMKIQKGANTGDVLRLKGKGINAEGRTPGDQLVTLKVMLPEAPDAELETFLKTWRDRHGYDPRSQLRDMP